MFDKADYNSISLPSGGINDKKRRNIARSIDSRFLPTFISSWKTNFFNVQCFQNELNYVPREPEVHFTIKKKLKADIMREECLNGQLVRD